MSSPQAPPAGRIYVYSAPGYDKDWVRSTGATQVTGRGRYKVGWTGRPDAKIRVREQTGTVYPDGDGVVIHLDEPAVRNDGTSFTDLALFHVLDQAGVHRDSEVLEATLDEIRAALAAVRTGRPYDPERTDSFSMRPEQEAAVTQTAAYFADRADDPQPARFLWNAKMRFGKTFTTYQLARTMGWRRVLVLTYKPAVRDAWREDLARHVDFSGWVFADRDDPADPGLDAPVVWFASFQDLLGTTADGAVKAHNVDLHEISWDCVVVDEYHFGAWQGAAKEVCAPVPQGADRGSADEADADRADEVADLASTGIPRLIAATPETGTKRDLNVTDLRLKSRRYLYLSGTPFRALTEGEFNEDQIFNWTYPDEQAAKNSWEVDPDKASDPNPYRELPQMQMFTYALAEMASAAIDQRPDGTFDLSGYFEASKVGPEYHFKDPGRVQEFLNMLRGRLTQSATEKLLNNFKPPFPYASPRFADAIEHSVWFLPTVASCHAMKAALEAHPYFRDFTVHVAAGSATAGGAAAKAPVDRMLDRAAVTGKQTITLSCGKLMTGVTVPQWGSILILRSLKSPESYFQAAFRVQSPWKVTEPDGTRSIKKETCYVFDFDPNRALTLIYQYGTKLAGASTSTSPSDVVSELIEFLPIFAFDGGRMDPVDVKAVMDWGTAGAGATMLAKRWHSPRLIDLSEEVLNRLLANSDLVERLEQMEDFRNLRQETSKLISQSRKLRGAKPPRKGEPEDPELAATRKAKREQVQTLRNKLLKFVQRIPLFMYLTDFREESLVHVIESLDTQLFERVTGLTISDFHDLSAVGVFNPAQMNEAIWQFRLFENASLHYLDPEGTAGEPDARVGLWDRSVSHAELAKGPLADVPTLLAGLAAHGLVTAGTRLEATDGWTATAEVTTDLRVSVGGDIYDSPQEAAAAVSGDTDVDGLAFWSVPGWGTLAEMAGLLESDE